MLQASYIFHYANYDFIFLCCSQFLLHFFSRFLGFCGKIIISSTSFFLCSLKHRRSQLLSNLLSFSLNFYFHARSSFLISHPFSFKVAFRNPLIFIKMTFNVLLNNHCKFSFVLFFLTIALNRLFK